MADLLPPERRTRLVRILGLLGSDHMGERATAGHMADQLIREAGLTWDHVVACTAPTAAREKASLPSWHQMAARILASNRANAWEITFCTRLVESWRGPVAARIGGSLKAHHALSEDSFKYGLLFFRQPR
jgi:hypothetical protein